MIQAGNLTPPLCVLDVYLMYFSILVFHQIMYILQCLISRDSAGLDLFNAVYIVYVLLGPM